MPNNPYSNLRWEDLYNDAMNGVRGEYRTDDYAYDNINNLDPRASYVSSMLDGRRVQRVIDDGGSTSLHFQDPNDTGYNYVLMPGENGTTQALHQRAQNGIPMEMLAVLAAPLMAAYGPGLFGAGGAGVGEAAAGSLADAMATYAPGWWEGVTAAGMGEAGFAPGIMEAMAAAGGVPEASLTEVMSQTNPEWWQSVTDAGMGDPGFAPGLTETAIPSSGASTSTGSSASGPSEITANSAPQSSFSDARYAADAGIDPSYVGAGTATNSLSSTLSSAANSARDFLSNPLTQAGASILNGVLTSNAAEDAANAQLEGINAGIGEQRRQYDQTRADLAPYRERGYQANNKLAMMMGFRPNATTYTGDMNTYQQDPAFNSGYQSAPQYQPGETANALNRYLRPLSNGGR